MGDAGRTGRQTARDALGELERSLSRLEGTAARTNLMVTGRYEAPEAVRSGLADVRRAVAAIKAASLDRVYASAGAERDAEAPGNLVVGVTAHCACGRTFTDDVRCCAPLDPADPGRPCGAAPPDGLEDLRRRHPHLAGNHVDAPPAPQGPGVMQPPADADDEDPASMAALGDPEGFRGSDYDYDEPNWPREGC